MEHQSIAYYDGDQKLIGALIQNGASNTPQPAIIVFPAFEGRGAFALQYGERLAQLGYVVLVADMYGDAAVETTIDGCFARITPFLQDRALVRRRALLALQTLCDNSQVKQDCIGAVGFCFGGMCALEIARSGANLAAVVSAHGVLTQSNLPTQAITSKILVLHGYQDPQVPPTVLPDFAAEMQTAGVTDWTVTFFGGAQHSFTDPKTGTFDPQREREMGRAYHRIAAERTFRYTVDFFAEVLQ